MKVYLAGPMRGVPDYNFPEFHKYAALLRSQGHEVFNPAELGLPQDNIREIFAVEMAWLCRNAEAVALIPGWSESPGARAEAALARALGLKLMGVPGFRPSRPLESHYPSGRRSSIISPSPSLKSPGYPLRDKNSIIPGGGTETNQWTMPTRSSVTTLSVALLIAMGLVILAKWLGGH